MWVVLLLWRIRRRIFLRLPQPWVPGRVPLRPIPVRALVAPPPNPRNVRSPPPNDHRSPSQLRRNPNQLVRPVAIRHHPPFEIIHWIRHFKTVPERRDAKTVAVHAAAWRAPFPPAPEITTPMERAPPPTVPEVRRPLAGSVPARTRVQTPLVRVHSPVGERRCGEAGAPVL